jgi:hypothetical protein
MCLYKFMPTPHMSLAATHTAPHRMHPNQLGDLIQLSPHQPLMDASNFIILTVLWAGALRSAFCLCGCKSIDFVDTNCGLVILRVSGAPKRVSLGQPRVARQPSGAHIAQLTRALARACGCGDSTITGQWISTMTRTTRIDDSSVAICPPERANPGQVLGFGSQLT